MIDFLDVFNYAMTLNSVEHEHKEAWGADLVKVGGKIFLLGYINKEGQYTLSLKCDPEYAIELRDKYAFIVPGFHLNKKHWNTIILSLVDTKIIFINELIKHSYDCVCSKLPKSQKKYCLS